MTQPGAPALWLLASTLWDLHSAACCVTWSKSLSKQPGCRRAVGLQASRDTRIYALYASAHALQLLLASSADQQKL